jgi:acetyltransferase-like isoleucine patch superfamily enzyme
MTEDDIGSIQSQLARPGSALHKYKQASVGDRGYPRLALYEVLLLATGSIPGAAGISLRRICYPLLFRHVGRLVVFGLDCSFRRPHCIELGDNVSLGARVALDVKDEDAAIILGSKVTVGEATIFSCPGGRLLIGEDTVIGRYSRLGSLMGLTIGRGCTIGDYTYIVGAGLASDSLERPIIEQPTTCKGPSSIGDRVAIGDRVTVLDGVTIGSGARIESGALVVRDVPPGSRVAGVPARVC